MGLQRPYLHPVCQKKCKWHLRIFAFNVRVISHIIGYQGSVISTSIKKSIFFRISFRIRRLFNRYSTASKAVDYMLFSSLKYDYHVLNFDTLLIIRSKWYHIYPTQEVPGIQYGSADKCNFLLRSDSFNLWKKD